MCEMLLLTPISPPKQLIQGHVFARTLLTFPSGSDTPLL